MEGEGFQPLLPSHLLLQKRAFGDVEVLIKIVELTGREEGREGRRGVKEGREEREGGREGGRREEREERERGRGGKREREGGEEKERGRKRERGKRGQNQVHSLYGCHRIQKNTPQTCSRYLD